MAALPGWYRAMFRWLPESFSAADRAELESMAQAEWDRVAGRGPRARWLVTARLAIDQLAVVARAWAGVARGSRPSWVGLEGWALDVRYAWRGLVRSPSFFSIAVAVIGLGITGTATILTVADVLLVRPPTGVREASRLVTVHEVARDGSGFHSFSYPDFRDLRAAARGSVDLAAYTLSPSSVRLGDEPRLVLGFGVSGEYFRVAGARAALGRLLSPADEQGVGGAPVAVLSHALWAGGFGGDSSIVGGSITINGRPFAVVGVAEPGFRGHIAALDGGLWLPIHLARSAGGDGTGSSLFENRDAVWLEVLGRMGDGSLDAVEERLSVVSAAGGRSMGLDFDRRVEVRRYSPMIGEVHGSVMGFMGLLLLLALSVLAIASTNVGGLVVARTLARSRELAIRLAIGAGRGRLIRSAVIETMLVFAVGAGVGIGLAWAATRSLDAIGLPLPIPIHFAFPLSGPIVAAVVVLSTVAGFGFGLAPAWRATRHEATRGLKDGGARSGGGTQRLRRGLVFCQVAASALLVVLAGYFGRAAAAAGSVRLGIEPAGVQAAAIDFAVLRYSPERTIEFVADVESRLRARPEVASVGAIDIPPLGPGNQTSAFAVPGREAREDVGLFGTDFARVTPGYFATMGVEIVRGRAFSDADRSGSVAAIIVNETVARTVWPGEDPIGQVVEWGSFTGGTPATVVGVARDGKYRSVGEAPRFAVYVPAGQDPPTQLTVVAKARDGADLSRVIMSTIQAVEPNLPLVSNTPYGDVIALGMLPNRLAAILATGFGALGTVLAVVGVYGVLAYLVTRRRREIAVRMALGAPAGSVRRMVIREGVMLAGAGGVVGVALAVLVARAAQGLLYGVDPFDLVSILGGAGVLGIAVLVASDLPARRAAATDPYEVLRDD